MCATSPRTASSEAWMSSIAPGEYRRSVRSGSRNTVDEIGMRTPPGNFTGAYGMCQMPGATVLMHVVNHA